MLSAASLYLRRMNSFDREARRIEIKALLRATCQGFVFRSPRSIRTRLRFSSARLQKDTAERNRSALSRTQTMSTAQHERYGRGAELIPNCLSSNAACQACTRLRASASCDFVIQLATKFCAFNEVFSVSPVAVDTARETHLWASV